MRISVFGLGYVGSVSAACLAHDGHRVVGVDTNGAKVDSINAGRSPIFEPGLADLISRAVASGTLRATMDCCEAIRATEVSFICVGTPTGSGGCPDLSHLLTASAQVGAALKTKDEFHVVVVRSTSLPGTLRSAIIPAIEQASGKRAGEGFGACFNPEFLREGSAVYDYYNPSRTVIGCVDGKCGKLVEKLYAHLPAPIVQADAELAEMVKLADNAWHAVKVSFANEIGTLCKAVGVDSQKAMDVFVMDTKLNISPSYLRPGFAFGGSCLPKDLRALLCRGGRSGLELPLLSSVLPSNQRHIERAVRLIEEQREKRIGLLGLAFKPDTDDVRESPILKLAAKLISDGFELRIFDPNVDPDALVGANREYLTEAVPHIMSFLVRDARELLEFSNVLVVGRNAFEFAALIQDLPRDRYTVIDLIGITRDWRSDALGVCW